MYAFIGSAGIPNRYGGFESFLEHCAIYMVDKKTPIYVTCDSKLYHDNKSLIYNGVNRIFIPIKANGYQSIFHDLFAFMSVFFKCKYIMVLGVSGGIWFPFFYISCRLTGKKLGVNVDGVEWRRGKFSFYKKILLRFFDFLAQLFSQLVVYDNKALLDYIYGFARHRAFEIAYSGDHVLRLDSNKLPRTALTVCRIEPENNIELLIEGALQSDLSRYTIIGNWNNNTYSKNLFAKYKNCSKLKLLDPIYDSRKIAQLRESCAIYLHGHSVGGTNPSLVEMIFYDSFLICYDVRFNRETAGECALYFKDTKQLVGKINQSVASVSINHEARINKRMIYTVENISNAYLNAFITIQNN